MAGTLRRLLGLLRPHRRRLAMAVTAGGVTVLAGVGLLTLSSYLIASAALRPPLLELTVAIVGVRALAILRGVARYGERLTTHDAAFRVLADLRVKVYDALVPLSPAGLAGERRGDVLSRVVTDVDALQDLFVAGIVPPLGGAVAAVAVVGITALLLPPATGVVAAGLVVGGVVLPVVAHRLGRRPGRRVAAAKGALTAEIVELLDAADELLCYGRAEEVLGRVEASDAELTRLDRVSTSRGGLVGGGLLLATGLTVVGVLLVAVPAVRSGELRGVLLGALAVLALAGFEAVAPVAAATQRLSATSTAARRLFGLMDRPAPVAEPATPAPAPAGGCVRLEHVSAGYPGAPGPTLHDVDLELQPGRRVAVVGRSGAGKTTLAYTLLRFLDLDAGSYRIDSDDVTTLAQDDVRQLVGLAAQDAHLFPITVAANVRIARHDATDEEIREALEAAQLGPWLASLPAGLDTLVGERGRLLSGGQAQRIVLARALLGGQRYLVLDEPTANLDAVTGAAFLRDALAATRDRGLLLITHDLRAMAQMDEILVLDAGRVVERGSHDALLARDGTYRRMWELERGLDTTSGRAGRPVRVAGRRG